VLPDAFLYGFTFVVQFAKQRGAFLNGDYSVTGWPQFFPYAFLVKTTLPFLLLLAVGIFAGVRAGWKNISAQLRSWTPLLALFGVYWLTSITSHLNIGHRHILPTYPVLFIAAGAFGAWLDLRRPLAALLVGALALCMSGNRGRRGRTISRISTRSRAARRTGGATSSTARSTGARICRG
jgi:hypothetical protein